MPRELIGLRPPLQSLNPVPHNGHKPLSDFSTPPTAAELPSKPLRYTTIEPVQMIGQARCVSDGHRCRLCRILPICILTCTLAERHMPLVAIAEILSFCGGWLYCFSSGGADSHTSVFPTSDLFL